MPLLGNKWNGRNYIMKTITNYTELGVTVIAHPDSGRYDVKKDDTLIYEIWNNGAVIPPISLT